MSRESACSGERRVQVGPGNQSHQDSQFRQDSKSRLDSQPRPGNQPRLDSQPHQDGQDSQVSRGNRVGQGGLRNRDKSAKRACNAILPVLFCLFILGPACLIAANAAKAPVPEWLSAYEAVNWLEGDDSVPDVLGNLNVRGFASKRLQTAVEDVVGNNIPVKARVLLANAAYQRAMIETCNDLFDWSCYPTYFGSKRLYIPVEDAVTYLPEKEDPDWESALATFAGSVNDLAAGHPDKRFVIVLVQGYQAPAVNPAYEYVTRAKLPGQAVVAMQEAIDASNCHFVSVGYDSLSEYYEDYFKSDHHWRYRGAARAFNAAAEKLGLEPYPLDGVPLDGYEFSGSTARWALKIVSDKLDVSAYDFSDITIRSPQGETTPYDHGHYFSLSGIGQKYSFYNAYYDHFEDRSVFSSAEGGRQGGEAVAGEAVVSEAGQETFASEAAGRGDVVGDTATSGVAAKEAAARGAAVGNRAKALIFGNSYVGGFIPYVTERYASAMAAEDLRPWVSVPDGETMSGLIEESGCDDVFIVASPDDIAAFQDNCPDYIR